MMLEVIQMKTVNKGDYVGVHYTGRLSDGRVFESSREREPYWFKTGQGDVLPGFERGILGLSENDRTTFLLPADQAFGRRDGSRILALDRTFLPQDEEYSTGDVVQVPLPGGDRIPARVVSLDEELVVLDFNHPLAGRSLVFVVEVVGIGKRPPKGVGLPDFSRSISNFHKKVHQRMRRHRQGYGLQGWPSPQTD
jgi:FKBP-type peptidyl-prolyl cis-trans isomerase 2